MKTLFSDMQTRYEDDEGGEVVTRLHIVHALYAPEMCTARLKIVRSGGAEEFGSPVNVTSEVAAVRMMLAAYDKWRDNLEGWNTWDGAAAAARVLRERDEAREMAVVA